MDRFRTRESRRHDNQVIEGMTWRSRRENRAAANRKFSGPSDGFTDPAGNTPDGR